MRAVTPGCDTRCDAFGSAGGGCEDEGVDDRGDKRDTTTQEFFTTDDWESGPSAFGVVIARSPDPSLQGRILPVESRLTFGRRPGRGGLVVEDGRLSRRHASIERRAGLPIYDLVDHESRNGSLVGGEPVQRAQLYDGSVIRLGGTVMVFGALPPASAPETGEMVGCSAAFMAAMDKVERVATSHLPVLILGPTGSGKELVARHIHARSDRRGAFVPVNCSAIPETLAESYFFGHRKGAFTGAQRDNPGFFAEAQGGTLFLDEAVELPPALQPKLLRVLETGDYTPVGSTTMRRANVRVVAATNVDLMARVEGGSFRQDLYARLAGYVIDLPPLSARRLDIPLLLRHFLARAAPGRRFEASASFTEAVLMYDWPMNVRELRTVAERLAVVDAPDGELQLSDLPPAVREPVERRRSASRAVQRVRSKGGRPSKEELHALLAEYVGNVSRLSSDLGADRRQVYRWLEYHGLDPGTYR